MFRLPILIAILAVAALPRVSAAQSASLVDTDEVRPDNSNETSPDARMDELVRRLNEQEAELSELRQSLANDAATSRNRVNPKSQATTQPSISLLNPGNRVKLHAGLDTLMVFSTSRPFPSGTPLFLLPESPFGLETNTFDAHARQSYVGGMFTGPKVGDFQTGAQILTFFQNDSLSTDDYGMLVYYAYGELKKPGLAYLCRLATGRLQPCEPNGCLPDKNVRIRKHGFLSRTIATGTFHSDR